MFVTFLWKGNGYYRHRFEARHVNAWARGIRRIYPGDHRLICITDQPALIDIETFPLWEDFARLTNLGGLHLPTCYRRLKIFDRATQYELGIDPGTRVISIDLDVVFVRNGAAVFDAHPEASFVGWKGISPTHQRPVYNGTLQIFTAGDPEVEQLWSRFNWDAPHQVAKAGYFGSDQGWLSWQLGGRAPGVDVADGMYSYSRDIVDCRLQEVPARASIVSFNGKAKPWHPEVQAANPWIRRYWGK